MSGNSLPQTITHTCSEVGLVVGYSVDVISRFFSGMRHGFIMKSPDPASWVVQRSHVSHQSRTPNLS